MMSLLKMRPSHHLYRIVINSLFHSSLAYRENSDHKTLDGFWSTFS